MKAVMYDVFISYSSIDEAVAYETLIYLEKQGLRCFFAGRDVAGKAKPDWAAEISNALRNSKLLLAVFSKNFNDSTQTDTELYLANEHKKPALVFRITDDDYYGCKEYFLVKYNWIKAYPQPESFFGDLYRGICNMLGRDVEINERLQIHKYLDKTDISTVLGESDVAKGKALFYSADGDKEMAAYLFNKAAKTGNPIGEYFMGVVYFYGNGMPNDWQKAKHYFSLSANHGNTQAMCELANMYQYGIGIERDTMKAMELYSQAANEGNGFAMKKLARSFNNGDLGVLDESRSIEYYAKAFDALYECAMGENDPIAQHTLGESFMDGEGVKQNYDRAVGYYERAVKNNYPNALNSLAICYREGWGVNKDKKTAFELQLKSSLLGLPQAMNNLSLNYFNAEGVEKNDDEYKKWQKKAAECGNPSALTNIGLDYWLGRIEDRNYSEAKKWFEKAIDGGSLESMYYLGKMYDYDEMDHSGLEKAFNLYKQSAIGGNVKSIISLASCYFYGIGTEEDKAAAANWYLRVAEVYECMVGAAKNHYKTPVGAGIYSHRVFDYFDADCFDNLAKMYRNGEGGLDIDDSIASKYEEIAKSLRGGLENIDQCDSNHKLVAQNLFMLGEDYYEAKHGKNVNYSEAARYYKLAAERGNIDAMNSYAECLECGNGIEKNEKEAAKWYKLAAEQKHKEAQLRYAYCLEYGIGIEENKAEAVRWYGLVTERISVLYKYISLCLELGQASENDEESARWFKMAAERGYKYKKEESMGKSTRFDCFMDDELPECIIESWCKYAKCLQDGKGVAKNEKESAWWYKLAAEHRDGYARYEYAKCLEFGIGVDKNAEGAAEWYKLAAEQGNSEAQLAYAICLTNGKGVAKNDEEAVELFRLAAEQGNMNARYYYAKCLESGQGTKKNLGAAVKWYRLAAEQGHIDAQYSYARCLELGMGVRKSLEQAARWYKSAAEQGNIEARYPYARCLELGEGVDKNMAEAARWYELAAEQGNNDAQYSYARCLELGEGLTKNMDEAVRLYELAAAQGNMDAQYSYARCLESGKGTIMNLTESARWYELAAKKGHLYAQCEYARFLKDAMDDEESRKWYTIASLRQGRDAGSMRYKIGIEENIVNAAKLYKLADERGTEYLREYLENSEHRESEEMVKEEEFGIKSSNSIIPNINPVVCKAEMFNTEEVSFTITDFDTPIIIFWGPINVGKTMTILRLARFLRENGYEVEPDLTFQKFNNNYEKVCCNFNKLINSADVANRTEATDSILIGITKNGRKVAQILDLAGELCYNSDINDFKYKDLHVVISAPNIKIPILLFASGSTEYDKRKYVESAYRFFEICGDNRDRCLVLFNKIDLTYNRQALNMFFAKNENYLYKRLCEEYPDAAVFFQYNNPRSFLFNRYSPLFLPFYTGRYTEYRGEKLYIPSPNDWPKELWKVVLRLIKN